MDLSDFADVPPRTSYCGVYIIIHEPSGLMYVGSSGDLHTRIRQHEWNLRRGAHHCAALQEAYRESPAIRIKSVLTDTREDAYDREQEFLNRYFVAGRVFNAGSNARNPMKGLVLSERSLARMRASAVGRGLGVAKSAEHKANISEALKGYKKTPEHIEKLRRARTGKSLTDDHKQKISRANLDRTYSEEHIERMRNLGRKTSRPVNVKGTRYESLRAASQALSLSRDTVDRRARSADPAHSDWFYE
ncbi:GIY-YIG catalytic domain protein [Caballeronia arationis]|uniref:GIY-YIG nuclease family protein n=1 Tax=Caballeronia arationis TaxID=1777142 RepID=UPI00074C8994|nr:GIY-YIG catalytic domain protein [Caballeronia arationis]